MLQSLLADRFNLRIHKQTKEVPMYVLTAENYQSACAKIPRVARPE